jgi:hypothetical protein
MSCLIPEPFQILQSLTLGNGIKFDEQSKGHSGEGGRAARTLGIEVAGPLSDQLVVESVQLGQVHEDRRVRTSDRPPLDLGEVGIRDPGPLLDLSEAEPLVLSGSPENVSEHGLAVPRALAL